MRNISPYPIRMNAELRSFLEKSAKKNKRSLHAEIIARLYATCDIDNLDDPDTAKIRAIVKEELSKLKQS